MIKRLFIFVIVNILIITTIGLLMNLLGINYYITEKGINYESLLWFSLLWGMGGAFISLLLSKWIAKMMMKVQIQNPKKTTNPQIRSLIERVHHFARQAGLGKMPEVGIYPSNELNAFATGATKNSALVAVSTGLLERMDEKSVDGVLAHEIAHIANGDMVTMTLIQGIINAIVIFMARVIAFAINSFLRRGESQSFGFIDYMVIFVLEIILSFFGLLVVNWFSRQREFRADAGGARYAGRENMISALRVLASNSRIIDQRTDKPAINAMKISNSPSKGFMALFASHPPLAERIKRLETGAATRY